MRTPVRLFVAVLMGIVTGVAATALAAAPASAGHSWNGYHWARGSYPINLRPVNSFSAGFRRSTVPADVNADWNRSRRFANRQRYWDNSRSTRRNCPYVSRSVRMCDYNWGATGWAGVAQIYVSGRHITKARVRINNYYGTSYRYRRHVHCQEFGHILGLGHQANGNHSCMDDSSQGWDEMKPNTHDYRMLLRIYDHLHSTAPQTASDDAQGHGANATGGQSDRVVTRLANGDLVISFILWAPDHR